jgi:hypothetical protein
VALITGQYTAGTVSSVVFRMPPGPCVVTVTSDKSSSATAYIGAGSSVTSSTGMPLVPSGAVSWAAYPGSAGVPVSVITTAGSAATVGWIISTPQ